MLDRRDLFRYVSGVFLVLLLCFSVVDMGICQFRGRPSVSLYYYEHKVGADTRILMSVDNATNSQLIIFTRNADSKFQKMEPIYSEIDEAGNLRKVWNNYYSTAFKTILLGKPPDAPTVRRLQKIIGGPVDGVWGNETWLKFFDYINSKTRDREALDLQLTSAPAPVRVRINRLDTVLEKASDSQEKLKLLELLESSGEDEIADKQFPTILKEAYGELEVRLISTGTDPVVGSTKIDQVNGSTETDLVGGSGVTEYGDENMSQASGFLNSQTFWITVVIGMFLIYVLLLILVVRKQRRYRARMHANLRSQLNDLRFTMGAYNSQDGEPASLVESIEEVREHISIMQDRLIHSAAEKPSRVEKPILDTKDKAQIAGEVAELLGRNFDLLRNEIVELRERISHKSDADNEEELLPDLASLVIAISSKISKVNDEIAGMRDILETEQNEIQASPKNVADKEDEMAQKITDSWVEAEVLPDEHDRSAPSDDNLSVYREAMESNVEMLHRQKLMEIATSENEEELNFSRLWLFTEYWKLANFSDEVSIILDRVQDHLLKVDPRFAEIQKSLAPPKIQATNESNVIQEYEEFRRSIELLEVPSVTVDDGALKRLRSFIIVATDRFYAMSPCPEGIAEGILRMVSLRPMAVTIGVTRYNKEYHDMVLPDENSRPTDKDQSSWIIVDLRKRGYVDRRTGDVLRKATVVLGS